MARKPTGNPTGRPPKEFDMDQFESLCGIWCTVEEIAAYFKICMDTLRDKVSKHYGEDFSVVYKRLYAAGTPSFRRKRRVLAEKNAAMNIWLGKIHLGEKETAQEIVVTPEHQKMYASFMAQLQAHQSALKIAESNINSDK